jgi:hypothetical protein
MEREKCGKKQDCGESALYRNATNFLQVSKSDLKNPIEKYN